MNNNRISFVPMKTILSEFPQVLTSQLALTSPDAVMVSVYEFCSVLPKKGSTVNCDVDESVSPDGKKTEDVGSTKNAVKKSREGPGNSKPGGKSGNNNNNGKSEHRQKSSSYATIIDIFVALVQKLGIWMYNIISRLNVSLPVFTISMSWLEIPALGLEFALNLPALERRGWLYYFVLCTGILFPMYLCKVVLDDVGELDQVTGLDQAKDATEDTANVFLKGMTKRMVMMRTWRMSHLKVRYAFARMTTRT